MKLRINSILTLVVLLIVSASCSDNFLEDKKNFGQIDDSFYQSQERTNWYINNLYYDFFYAYKSPQATFVGQYTDAYSRLTEEIGGITDLVNPTKTLINSDDATNYFGTKLEDKIKNEPYNRIRDCNSFLEDVDVKGSTLDKTFRDRAKGQVYYLRAIQYFDLMRMYGGVPLVTSTQGASSTDEAIKLPRASVTEVVKQIVADLDMAASLLPGNWPDAGADYGRFTKGAALAQKARVLLTYASPLFNKNWDGSTERWEAALQAGLAAEAQLTADGYGLYGTNAKQWNDMFTLEGFNKEAIVVQLLGNGATLSVSNNNSWEKAMRLVSQGGTGAFEAPKEMIDLFPMSDGKRPTAANGYDPFLFFKKRDPRFYRTFAFSGMKWGYAENANSVAWSYRWLDSADKDKPYFSDNNQENSPAYVRKMSNVTASNATNFQYSVTNIIEYRYAELLLNIAECYAAKGDIGNAVNYIGKVRARVGIPAADNYGIGILADKYAAIAACLYERRVELAYEGKRFWDVQRWMLYSDEALPGINGGTVSKLGLTPINGTQRTGYYLQYNKTASKTDPLTSARASISVDPDAANFSTQIDALATFYTTNFTFTNLLTPLDNVNNAAAQIKFNPNYYIMGLQTSILTQNTWLQQTVGWNGGTAGTFNYQE